VSTTRYSLIPLTTFNPVTREKDASEKLCRQPAVFRMVRQLRILSFRKVVVRHVLASVILSTRKILGIDSLFLDAGFERIASKGC